MHPIEQIILAATGQPAQQAGEDRQAYLTRLVKPANDALMNNDEWRRTYGPDVSWVIAAHCELANRRPAPEFDADTKALRERALEYGAEKADEYLRSVGYTPE